MISGFLREIDSVGRVVVPMQYRKELGIVERGSAVELFCDGKQIIIKSHVPSCVFCSAGEELTAFEEKYICKSCLEKLGKTDKD